MRWFKRKPPIVVNLTINNPKGSGADIAQKLVEHLRSGQNTADLRRLLS